MIDSSESCILLIDDESRFLDRMTSLLGKKYEIYTALSGAEGLTKYSDLKYRKPLVICDLKLKDMSGSEVCRTIKRVQNDYVMMLTAYSDKSSRMSCLKAQADHYLDKTIDDEELKLVIRNIYNTLNSQLMLNLRGDVLSTPNDSQSLQQQVREFIFSSYGFNQRKLERRNCTSQMMAEKLNKTHRTFQRDIKNESGFSFKQLHLIVRLEYSKTLLDCGYNVSQVADLLAFSSPSHLSRTFKGHFDLTTSQYRYQ